MSRLGGFVQADAAGYLVGPDCGRLMLKPSLGGLAILPAGTASSMPISVMGGPGEVEIAINSGGLV